MPDFSSVLTPRAPFSDLPAVTAPGRGVLVRDRDGLGLATLLARQGRHRALADRLHERFGIELPQGSYRSSNGAIALLGTAPGIWLATAEQGGNAFPRSLLEAIGEFASVVDQSDGYAVLRLSGLKARDTLAKLVPVDVHPRAFKIGAVAATVAAHIGATLWRLDDGNDGAPVFEIAVFRSLALSFWQVLIESAAEFGVVVEQV